MINSFRFIFIILFFFSNSTLLLSQDRSNYGLLWEIQHKDSNKKSYLFGTMHVKDSRVFKFSDSVIPAIKNSEIFALEVSPDSINNNFEEDYYSVRTENIYKKILSKEDYQRLKDRFYEINKTDFDSIPIMHPYIIESMLFKQKQRPDDRRTFLDAHLYGLAYNEGKEIIGLEKLEDQIPKYENVHEEDIKESILSTLNSSTEQQDMVLEHLVQLYSEGNLDLILDYINEYDKIDDVIINRNIVMTNNLVIAMQNKTVFAAVGTAHLPGKEGILDLLQKKGYTVRQVNATFTEEKEEYVITPNLDRWFQNIDNELGYKVLTPSKAIALDYFEKYKTMSSTDLIFGGTFAYLIMDLRSETLNENFDFIGNIIQSQAESKNDSILSKKIFTKEGIEFTEVLIQKENNVSRMRVAFYNKIIYSFFSESTLKEITSPYADAFFNSIEVFEPTILPSVWRTKTDSVGAYSVDIPEAENDRSLTRENPIDESAPYLLNIFSSAEKDENTVYLFRYNNQPVGYYLRQNEEYYSEFENYFKEQGTIIGEAKDINLGPVKGKEYEVLLTDKYHTIARIFLRGNRTYLLMAQKLIENEKVSAENRFLNSFKFLPFAQTPIDTIVNINEHYSFKPISKEVVFEEELETFSLYSDIKSYSSMDFSTGGTYLVQHSRLKPYFRKKSVEDFYNEYVDLLVDYNDTITSNFSTTWAGKPARDIRMQNKDTHVKRRMRLLLDEDNVLVFLTFLGDEEINEPKVDAFFNSLEIKKESKKFDLTASKADLIFKKLRSKDSTDFSEAKIALQQYDFDASEYKILKKNLKKDFIDDTSNYGAKNYLIDAMVNFEKPETLKTFTDYYNDEKNGYYARIEVLSKIIALKNSEAIPVYFDLIQNNKPERITGKYYGFLDGLADTIPLFVANDAMFSKLADVDDYRDKIASLYAYNILGDSIYADRMPLLKNKLISHMYSDSELFLDSLSLKKHPHISNSLINSYIKIGENLNEKDPEFVKTLKLLLENLAKDQWLLDDVIMAAAALDVEIDSITINEAFENIFSRFGLMQSFINSKKGELIPKEYLEPIEFHKISLLNSIAYDYDEYPEYFNFLGTTTIEGKNYYAYSFSYSEDDEEKHLGLSEETEINISEFKAPLSYSNWEILEEDWKTQAEKIVGKNTISDDSIME